MRSGRSSPWMNSRSGRLGSVGWLRRERLSFDSGRGGFKSGMGCGEACDWDPVGRTGDVIEADLVTEFHGARLTTMLTADSDLQVWTDAPTGCYGKSNQLANAVPVENLERIVGKYTTIYIIG